MLKKSLIAVLSVSGLLLVGCGESSPPPSQTKLPAVDTKKVDDAAKKTGDAVKDATKDAAEKTKEAVDTGAAKAKDAADSAKAAADKAVGDMGK